MYHIFYTTSKQLLPKWIYQRLVGDWGAEGFKKYFKNTGWIFVAKVTTLVISFFTMAIVARYLGPENLGRISYAQSFTALFSVFASLGLNQILYRELVANPDQEGKLLGTAICAKFIFGIFTLLTTVLIAYQIDTDQILTWLITITTLTFILQPLGTVSIIFNARVQSKYPAYITIVIALLIPALKLIVIFFDRGILYFAAIIAFEAFFYSVANLYLYLVVTKHSLHAWKFSIPIFKELFKHSWPLVLVGASGYLYGRVDQVMLQHFLNSTAVGFYDVAVRLTELLGFIPGMIIGSLFPAIVSAKKTNRVQYLKRSRALVILCLSISITLASILFLLAPLIIHILFGYAFEESIRILRIYVWSNIGTIAMILITQYIIVEKKSHLILIFTISSAILNVLLNLVLIPRFGAEGAAYATVTTLAFASILFIFIRHRLIS